MTEPTTFPSNGQSDDAASRTAEQQQPVYQVGRIATDKNNAVSAKVWAIEFTDRREGQTITVYNVTVHAEWRDADGNWKPAKCVCGSHLYALIYCLQRASDWILGQRDPQNDCPF